MIFYNIYDTISLKECDLMNYVDEKGNVIDISVIGYFSIPGLDKTFIMYEYLNDNDLEYGHVLLGEVINEDNNVQILGINPEEEEIVVAYYNEISNQLGGE